MPPRRRATAPRKQTGRPSGKTRPIAGNQGKPKPRPQNKPAQETFDDILKTALDQGQVTQALLDALGLSPGDIPPGTATDELWELLNQHADDIAFIQANGEDLEGYVRNYLLTGVESQWEGYGAHATAQQEARGLTMVNGSWGYTDPATGVRYSPGQLLRMSAKGSLGDITLNPEVTAWLSSSGGGVAAEEPTTDGGGGEAGALMPGSDEELYADFIDSIGGNYFDWQPADAAGNQDTFQAGAFVAQEGAARPGAKKDGPQPDNAGGWEQNLYDQLGLAPDVPGELQDIIDQAIREDWTMSQFTSAVYASRAFERLFPNIKRPDGSLRMSPGEYRTLQEAYEEIGNDFGIGVNRFRAGLLIEGGVSPQEFARRAQAIQNVRGNKGLMDAYNDQLRQAGLSPLDEQGFFRFVAGAAGPEYYDVYEGALLATSGLDLTTEEARAAAKKIGQPGEPIDVAALVRDVKALLPDAGPELMQQGITDADLVQLAAGVDPRGIASTLQTIVANRRSQGSFVAGSPLRQGAGGGLATLPEDVPNY